MMLLDAVCVVWLCLAGYALSVLRDWKNTSKYLRKELGRLLSEEDCQ